MRSSEKGRFFATLADAFAAGLSATAALDLLRGNERFAPIAKRLHQAAARGESLSSAFRKESEFSDFDSELIAVGEKSGSLDVQFKILADRYANISRLNFSIAAHLVGPPLYYLVALGVALTLLVSANPEAGRAALTRAFWDIVASAIILYAIVHPFIHFPYGDHSVLQRYYMRLPLIYGSYVRMKIFLPFVNSVRLLYQAGLTIGQAIEIAARSTNVQALVRDLRPMAEQLKNGKALDKSLFLSDLLPSDVRDAMRVGYAVGKLEESLIRIEEDYSFRMEEILKQVPFWISVIAAILMMGVCISYMMVQIQGYVSFLDTVL